MSTSADSSSHSNPGARSHPTAWTIVVLILLPILYLLSVPPAVIFTMKGSSSLPTQRRVQLYAAPSHWLQAHTPLAEPLDRYFEWWCRKADFHILKLNGGNLRLTSRPPPP